MELNNGMVGIDFCKAPVVSADLVRIDFHNMNMPQLMEFTMNCFGMLPKAFRTRFNQLKQTFDEPIPPLVSSRYKEPDPIVRGRCARHPGML